MSIEQTDVIDAIGVDKETGEVVLTISDHLEWDDAHLLLLQEKINLYIGFVEAGELEDAYPNARGRKISINVVCKYSPNLRAKGFLSRVGPIVEQAGVKFSFQVSDVD
ncbi:DUF6572 domain-containing protein [Pseudomonas corrugata]|uniref:Uncharacterized protein n=1 Tax=Pseudomonas corrugata TaxID=47879 RepID=A0A8B6USZ9_9PSED|nr:DUF6572 domain-containing protein [Pseudomonas corrugata]QTH15026.1 hypothetical protein C4C32_03705 [Pseudomonas corrugata]